MNEVTNEHVGSPMNDFFTLPHITNKIRCLKFNTQRSRRSPGEWQAQQEWTYISTIFPLTTKLHEIKGRGQEHLEQTKGPCFQEEMKYSCHGWQLCYLPRFKSSHKTFSGHHYDVKEFWAPHGLWGDQLFAFWISFFNPYIPDGLPKELTSVANVHKPVSTTLAPAFGFAFVFRI